MKDWQKLFETGREMILSSFSSKSGPHSVVMISQGFLEGRLLINVCYSKTSVENIKKEKRVSVIGLGDGKYYRIKGEAEAVSSGKYFEAGKKRDKDPGLGIICTLVIEIKEVFDLDEMEEIPM